MSDVDYLVYYPRTDGANGKFKEVEIQYSEDGSAFTPLADKDFLGSASATKVLFDAPVRAKSFRFIVKTGAGDGQGFVSCAEMEFYAKNPEAFDYSTLFADETCSELKAGITEADIEKCEFPFFKNLAYYMIKGKYEPEFRVGEFKAYPNPDIQSGTHKTNPYSLLDNPTGISVKANENLIVLVGDTHGYDISLKVQNLDAPESDGFGGVTYPLSRGTNKLTISEKGLVYVMYHTRTLDDAAALPVKIHFASGTVNGYFDSQKHEGRWNELLGKATDKYFDVVGKYAHMTFETNDYRKYAANNGNELIDLYDQIAFNEMQLLGLEKYDKMFRNRMYLNVMYQSYMYATSYHTAYNQTTMSDICNPSKLKTSACWGPAHEIGHCNQTRLGVMWIGMTEVTNNIMSEYIQTTIFGQGSRIQTEDMGDVYRNRYSKAWNGIIVAGSSHADFSNIGDDANDVFCKLVPFWQLELYFGKVLGRTPLQQSDKGGFYPNVYEYARNKDYTGMTDGDIQLDFVYNCCLSAKMNLLDFFEKWGFLTPVNKKIEDYDTRNLTVTPDMVDALRHKVNGLGYSKPDVALEYISDNSFELYKSRASVVAGSHATHTAKSFTEGKTEAIGEAITIQGWKNVVAYEVKDADEKLIFVCSGETTPSSTHTFILPLSWKACWGPAHEIGHCNQTRLGVMWIGMTEVTNNIMSEYIQTTIFGQGSRIQTEDMGDVYRNRYSKAWNGIIVAGSSHADFSNIGDDANDVFCKLVPFWQLELYFGKVLGRTPLQQSDKGGFYPNVYEYARNKDYTGMTDGDIQLDFVYNCCLSAKMNLLDFFEKWGFLTPVNKKIEDYDTRNLTVTPDMVDALRHKVNGLGYSKPDVALEYISDNSFELYKSRASVVAGSHATHTAKSFTEGKTEAIGEAITIQGWKNVVAYEVKDADEKLIFVCSGETTPSSTHTFILPLSWKEGFKLYAVSATGDRTEVTMN